MAAEKLPLGEKRAEEYDDRYGSAASAFTSRRSGARRSTRVAALLAAAVLALCLALSVVCAAAADALSPPAATAAGAVHSLAKYAVEVNAAAAAKVLQVFQVYPPVLKPVKGKGLLLTDGYGKGLKAGDSDGCVVTQLLMKHTFGNSFDEPFVGRYTPPKKCKFNRVTFNFTVTAAGRQFDRLATASFGNIEIFRTSTAEPTEDGIKWEYIKDMSNYLALFEEEQKLIFDLGNLINNIYTAPYHALLHATFFTADETVDPAHRIIAVSARRGGQNMQSSWQYPMQKAENALTLPRNVRKAVFTVAATGQIDEEFWFGNVLESDVDTFGKGLLLGDSPFREVQLHIDGQLAGVVWPFPIIFTGGVVPGLWRPIVGIDAFDLREDEIDITPWLPLLCDGKRHKYEIRVVGINDDGKGRGRLTGDIGSYWVLTGKIFLWLDPKGSVTSGSAIQRNAHHPTIGLKSKVTKNKKGKNETLAYTVDVSRDLLISSHVKTASGTSLATWQQSLKYHNHGDFTNRGNVQFTNQKTSGHDSSSSGYSRHISYPVTVNTTFTQNPKNFTIDATLSRGQTIRIAGTPVFPTGLQSFDAVVNSDGNTASGTKGKGAAYQGSTLTTSQNGTAHYFALNDNSESSSNGTTQQDMTLVGFRDAKHGGGSNELYSRHVLAENAAVVEDDESVMGAPFSTFHAAPSFDGALVRGFAGGSVKALLGHGPGKNGRGQ